MSHKALAVIFTCKIYEHWCSDTNIDKTQYIFVFIGVCVWTIYTPQSLVVNMWPDTTCVDVCNIQSWSILRYKLNPSMKRDNSKIVHFNLFLFKVLRKLNGLVIFVKFSIPRLIKFWKFSAIRHCKSFFFGKAWHDILIFLNIWYENYLKDFDFLDLSNNDNNNWLIEIHLKICYH